MKTKNICLFAILLLLGFENLNFPGDVPEGSERMSKTLVINGDFEQPHWQYAYGQPWRDEMKSTGMYAAPGEKIMVSVPVDILNKGIKVLIGVHLDDLSKKENPARDPVVTKSKELIKDDVRKVSGGNMASIEFHNKYGGLIYILIPTGSALGDFEVTVSNAVKAPHFVLGEMTNEEWIAEHSKNPAPWAEMETSKMILTLRSTHVRDMEDPIRLMEFWNRVLDADADLAGIDRENRARAERIAIDDEISMGWMHSGYPMMAYTEGVAANLVNYERLSTQGDWGFFHELGHNHQWMDWVLDGTTETSCNLFSVYVLEKVVGMKDGGHGAVSPEARAERRKKHFENGAKLKDWNVWVALETMLMIKEAFGWEPYTRMFQRYMTFTTRPKDNFEKIDWFVKYLSLETEHNLAPFFEYWGVPVSDSIEEELITYPVFENYFFSGSS